MTSDQRGSLPLVPAQAASVHVSPSASAMSWIRLDDGKCTVSSARVCDVGELLGGGCSMQVASRGC